jgi:DNA processing protein
LNIQKDLIYQIALLKVKGMGPYILRKMIAQFKSAESIYAACKADFIEKNLYNPTLYNNIKSSIILIQDAENELTYCNKHNIKVISYYDNEYPYRLKECKDAPQYLFYRGNENISKKRIISVVGTRNPTNYGIQFCKTLCEILSSYKVTIVSGLAHGIDYNAHYYALKNHLSTFAVLGHGHQYIYPSNHLKISKEIQNKGLLISEFSSLTKPNKYTFPKRNRIIAGISDATIIIESPLKGGAMITARIANSYNKDVFALPGNVFSDKSAGCNHLIKNNEAHLIDSAEELIKMMGWEKGQCHEKKPLTIINELSPEEFKIVTLLQKEGKLSIDELCFHLNENINRINIGLTQLEIKGIIQQRPGKIFHYIG